MFDDARLVKVRFLEFTDYPPVTKYEYAITQMSKVFILDACDQNPSAC